MATSDYPLGRCASPPNPLSLIASLPSPLLPHPDLYFGSVFESFLSPTRDGAAFFALHQLCFPLIDGLSNSLPMLQSTPPIVPDLQFGLGFYACTRLLKCPSKASLIDDAPLLDAPNPAPKFVGQVATSFANIVKGPIYSINQTSAYSCYRIAFPNGC